MRHLVGIATLALVLSFNAIGADKANKSPEKQKTLPVVPAFDFKGLPLASTEQDMKSRFPDFGCNDPKDAAARRLADRSCLASPDITCRPNTWCENDPEKPWNYAGIRTGLLMMSFYNNELSTISISIKPGQFDLVTKALIVKYGEPTARSTQILTTRAGAQYENQILRWENQHALIIVNKYSGSVNDASVTYKLKKSIEEYRERSKLGAEEAAKNL